MTKEREMMLFKQYPLSPEDTIGGLRVRQLQWIGKHNNCASINTPLFFTIKKAMYPNDSDKFILSIDGLGVPAEWSYNEVNSVFEGKLISERIVYNTIMKFIDKQ
jgi:hypothetical protein